MKNLIKRRTEGFTIIEVTIVLAIAGLIMLMVFIAVPALQRNTRNSQRRNDAAHLSSLVNEYASNHAGALPTTIGTGNGNLDVSKENWAIMTAPATANIVTDTSLPADNTHMNINKNYKCNPADNTLTASSKSFAITFKVEASGGDQDSCVSE
jgi:prepilin-type N-terminal cleavage/methylation domain-containing protein